MKKSPRRAALDRAAGNGIIDRRVFLGRGSALVGAAGAGVLTSLAGAAAEPLAVPDWSWHPGTPFADYTQPSRFEAKVVRAGASLNGAPGTGAFRTPPHRLEGMITPNSLHFERSHSGVPDIDPDAHRMVIHGLVRRPLIFTTEALSRYPMTSRIAFLECAGNSGLLYAEQPADAGAQAIHGLVSCAEWTGVMLSTLLDEAGVDPRTKWLLAEGADAAAMSRSVPLAKAMDDAMIALYQNGERRRPSNGYPVRLLLPGYEGNMNVKWLRRLKLVEAPIMTKDETSKYSILGPDGKAWQFFFPMEVKSVVTRPSPGLVMSGPGFYEISGIAWSGNGKITKVEVSADGGKSWAAATLQGPVLAKAVTRFRLGWQWNGGPAVLQSRATDSAGNVQPTRDQLIAERGVGRAFYHCNAIASWAIDTAGVAHNAYV